MIPREPIDSEHSRNPDRLMLFTGLLGDVSTLIAEIESSQAIPQEADDEIREDTNIEQPPYQQNYMYTFELIGECIPKIPAEIIGLMPDIDQITVTLGQSDPETPSYLSVDFMSKTRTITVSRSGNPEDEAEFDYSINTDTSDETGRTEVPFTPLAARDIIGREAAKDFNNRLQPIDRISRSELNKFLMSLVYPSSDRTYLEFEQADFLTPDAFDILKESFDLAALNNLSSPMYTFSQGEAEFNYIKIDGQPISFTICYPELRTGRTIIAQNNLETDFRLVFKTVEAAEYIIHAKNGTSLGKVTIDEGSPYYPSNDELTYLRSLFLDEIRLLSPEPVPAVDDRVDSSTPDKIFEASGRAALIFSEVYIQNKLDQLDGGTPESDIS